MKKLLINKLFLLGSILISSVLVAQNIKEEDRIIGVWLTEKRDGKVEIYKVNNRYYGKLIWGTKMYQADGKTSVKDSKNPDAKLRSRDLKNLVFMTDFVYKDDAWEDGKIYDPNSGETYSCTIKYTDSGIEIRGYIGISLFGKSEKWTRVK